MSSKFSRDTKRQPVPKICKSKQKRYFPGSLLLDLYSHIPGRPDRHYQGTVTGPFTDPSTAAPPTIQNVLWYQFTCAFIPPAQYYLFLHWRDEDGYQWLTQPGNGRTVTRPDPTDRNAPKTFYLWGDEQGAYWELQISDPTTTTV